MSIKEDITRCGVCRATVEADQFRKRIVVCCDGTGNSSDQGVENEATNVGRLSRVIANVGYSQDGKEVLPQIVYYQTGLATGKMTWASSKLQGAMGEGLDEKVCQAYNYVVNNYGPGDEIFLFGFSRGAYTARALASLICQIGLLTPGMMDFFDEIWQRYKQRDEGKDFTEDSWMMSEMTVGDLGARSADIDIPNSKHKKLRRDYIDDWAHSHVRIKVVGVWDTVGSIGMSGWVQQPGTDVTYQSTRLYPKIENAFHALALDETRGNFAPTLYYLDNACKTADAVPNLRQCWFPGFHCDIGGHSDPTWDTNSTDEITFAWMIDQLTRDNLLTITRKGLQYPILERLSAEQTNNDLPAPKNNKECMERRVMWSDGKLLETNGWFYWTASAIATRRLTYQREPGVYYASDGTTRVDYRDYNETIHPCVWHRMKESRDAYAPAALDKKRWKRQRVEGGPGFEWIRTGKLGEDVIRLGEYAIPKIEEGRGSKNHWSGSLERLIVPSVYLAELDKANRV